MTLDFRFNLSDFYVLEFGLIGFDEVSTLRLVKVLRFGNTSGN
jgi:hypothetical protein